MNHASIESKQSSASESLTPSEFKYDFSTLTAVERSILKKIYAQDFNHNTPIEKKIFLKLMNKTTPPELVVYQVEKIRAYHNGRPIYYTLDELIYTHTMFDDDEPFDLEDFTL
ncbi:MAG: hypothetical protein ACFE9L_16955 [Candidatus Hodarchaeota archaeon]